MIGDQQAGQYQERVDGRLQRKQRRDRFVRLAGDLHGRRPL